MYIFNIPSKLPRSGLGWELLLLVGGSYCYSRCYRCRFAPLRENPNRKTDEKTATARRNQRPNNHTTKVALLT